MAECAQNTPTRTEPAKDTGVRRRTKEARKEDEDEAKVSIKGKGWVKGSETEGISIRMSARSSGGRSRGGQVKGKTERKEA